MVEHHPPALDDIFHALADPTRRAMLGDLGRGERSVGALAAPHRISLAAASKHVRTLERAGLLRRTVRGRTHVCALEPAPLAAAEAWLRHYTALWTARLDALEAALRRDATSAPGSGDPAPGTTTAP